MNVRFSCPACGSVLVDMRRVSVFVRPTCTDEDSTYGFPCPSCEVYRYKQTDPDRRMILISGGATVERVPLEADEQKPDTPMTYDDLLDFRLSLESLEPSDFHS